jgi:hypothetical protein
MMARSADTQPHWTTLADFVAGSPERMVLVEWISAGR